MGLTGRFGEISSDNNNKISHNTILQLSRHIESLNHPILISIMYFYVVFDSMPPHYIEILLADSLRSDLESWHAKNAI